ncbi:hypothetical protein IWW34DRAFT_774462 [Fusarium oxysporum f. sp. albedinis]|nr:hypothetical protein IWW34DRAFT_774462 [Fusarium oxysporum f. sp. albedinis]KAJ0132255.1 hypothetical protein HZ326_24659 [Fusarium oxysporum f. sp. albedinis]
MVKQISDGHLVILDAPWQWICHRCNVAYRFAVTNRCLGDGHRFCLNSKVSGAACQDLIDIRYLSIGQRIRPTHCWNECRYPLHCREQKDCKRLWVSFGEEGEMINRNTSSGGRKGQGQV